MNSHSQVMHDCSTVSHALADRYGITLNAVFDTQVAHAVFSHLRQGRTLQDARPISFVNLQRQHNPQGLMANAQNPSARTQT